MSGKFAAPLRSHALPWFHVIKFMIFWPEIFREIFQKGYWYIILIHEICNYFKVKYFEVPVYV